MRKNFEINTSITNSTINGYPSESTLAVIRDNNGFIAHIFVEMDGKLIISVSDANAIEIRDELVRKNLPQNDYFKCSVGGGVL